MLDLGSAAVHVVTVGKAAAGMFAACLGALEHPPVATLAIGPNAAPGSVRPDDWVTGGHPFPTEGSMEGGRRALALAKAVPPDACLVLLISGGASALMAAPTAGVSLDVKQRTGRAVMTAGGDITALNAVRKHLSMVKGGRLAGACRGRTVTLALSDVVGDDLSVIGSGPGVPDPSTWGDARDALLRFGGRVAHDAAVFTLVEAGCRGVIPETPKPGDPAIARATGHVIGGRRHAVAAARTAAVARGYDAIVLDSAVIGEARTAVDAWWPAAYHPAVGRPVAVISSGETTVQVTGDGRGGRNQEFALAATERLRGAGGAAVLASLGTDGIDGPTDAAGAVVDSSTSARATAAGLESTATFLARNDSYAYFDRLGDLVKFGPTGTNVGDLQILLLSPA